MDLNFVVRVGYDETTETVHFLTHEQLDQSFPLLAKWAEFTGVGDWIHIGTAHGSFMRCEVMEAADAHSEYLLTPSDQRSSGTRRHDVPRSRGSVVYRDEC